jgi:signal transduction histidine kinase
VNAPRALRQALVVVACFTAVGVLFGSQTVLYSSYAGRPVGWVRAIGYALITWYIWAALMPAVLWSARWMPVQRGRWVRAVAWHVVASVGFAILHTMLRILVNPYIDPAPLRFSNVFISVFHWNAFTYWSIVGIVHAVSYHDRLHERERAALQLEARLARAQLDVLRMQLHPHFLFNTLHAISALMDAGETEAADRMLAELSDLLRLTLDNIGRQEVALRQEIDFLERYVHIQQTRFQDRLRITIEADPAALPLSVPNQILQPLVENAIRHGIAPRASGGSVAVHAWMDGSRLHITVTDDGIGRREGVVDGMGLTNTRARLQELYGAGHEFSVTNQPTGGVQVAMSWMAE